MFFSVLCRRGDLPSSAQSTHYGMRDSTLILSLKILKGNFVGYYAIIAETTENMQTITKQDEVEVNYLKKSFGSGL